MKKSFSQFLVLALTAALVSLSGCSSSKKAAASVTPKQDVTASENTSDSGTRNAASDNTLVGTWAFEVKGAPDGDVKGDMIISNEGNTVKGIISAFGGQSEIQSLKIEQNLLTGIFYYNGMAINMSGTFNGNNYNGKVEAEGYAFPMTAVKK